MASRFDTAAFVPPDRSDSIAAFFIGRWVDQFAGTMDDIDTARRLGAFERNYKAYRERHLMR